MFKLIYYMIRLPFEIILLPLRIMGIFANSEDSNTWGLTKEERKRAREEGMSDADYIEAEERDDDCLDTDDF